MPTKTNMDAGSGTAEPTDRVRVVPVTNLQGMRKVKNFTLEGCPVRVTDNVTIGWALVYVPNVERAGAIDALAEYPGGPVSLYEPNQHVIMQGVWNSSEGTPIRRFSRLSRNLNSEDGICLVIRQYTADGVKDVGDAGENWDTDQAMLWTIKYAIAY